MTQKDEESQIDRDRLIEWINARRDKLGPVRVTPRKIFINSPWENDSKFHCALFPERGKFGRFRDFKSEKAGAIPNFIMEIDGCEFGEAMKMVGFRSGFHASLAAQMKRRKASLIEEDPNASLVLPGDPVRLKKDNKEDLVQAAWGYMMDRGIDPRRYEMYVCMDDRRFKQPDGSSTYQKLFGRILIPFRNDKGHIIYWTARTMDDEEQPKYQEPFDEEVSVPKESVIFAPNWDFKGKTVLLTEGWACTASLTDCGFYAGSTQGSMLYKEQARILKKHNVRLVFAYDRDAPGRRGVVNGRKMFLSMGGDSNIGFVFPPEGHDWNSAKREYGTEWVTDYIHERVKPLDDYAAFLIESTLPPVKESNAKHKYIQGDKNHVKPHY